jgi:hypothetical protein
VVTIADSTGNMAGVGTLNTHTIPGGTDTFAMLGTAQSFTALQTFATAARSSGSASYFAIHTPADTGLAADTESIGSKQGGSSAAATVNRQFAQGGGTFTRQAENLVVHPTYSFTSADTIVTACTLCISGAPIAGTNATITNNFGFLVTSNDRATNHFGVKSDGTVTAPLGTSGSEKWGAGISYGTANPTGTVVVGPGIDVDSTSGNNNTLVGAGIAQTGGTSFYDKVVAIGTGAQLQGNGKNDIVLIGYDARSQSSQSVMIGSGVRGNGTGGSGYVGIGQGVTIDSAGAIVIGKGGNSGVSNSGTIVLSEGGTGTAPNQFVVGSSTADRFISNVYIGNGVTATSPQAITYNATGGSGSNVAGASLTIAGGKATGNAAPGSVKLQTSVTGSSGSTLQTLSDRVIINGARKALTDATDADLFEIALPTLKGATVFVRATIFAADGTDVQARTVLLRVTAVNKGGAYTTDASVVSETATVSAGTLTGTWSIVNGTNKVTIRLNPDTSLTATTFYTIYSVENESEQAITIL